MQEWMHDWQVAGEWLLTRARHDGTPSDIPKDSAEQDGQPYSPDESQSVGTLEAGALPPWREPAQLLGHRLEKRRSLRVRMQRGVSEGYVLALKTVAAVRRATRD